MTARSEILETLYDLNVFANEIGSENLRRKVRAGEDVALSELYGLRAVGTNECYRAVMEVILKALDEGEPV